MGKFKFILVILLFVVLSPIEAYSPPPKAIDEGYEGSLFGNILGSMDGKLAYPFPELRKRIEERLGESMDTVIPFGRSLQKNKTSLEDPRVLFTTADDYAANFFGKFFMGYAKQAHAIEVISWNTRDREFDFYEISNYNEKGKPTIKLVSQIVCRSCHQSGAGIFTPASWNEAIFNNSTNTFRSRLMEIHKKTGQYESVVLDSQISGFDFQARMSRSQEIVRGGNICRYMCKEDAECRARLIYTHLTQDTSTFRDSLLEKLRKFWPKTNYALPGNFIPNRSPEKPDYHPDRPNEKLSEGELARLDPAFKRAIDSGVTEHDAETLLFNPNFNCFQLGSKDLALMRTIGIEKLRATAKSKEFVAFVEKEGLPSKVKLYQYLFKVTKLKEIQDRIVELGKTHEVLFDKKIDLAAEIKGNTIVEKYCAGCHSPASAENFVLPLDDLNAMRTRHIGIKGKKSAYDRVKLGEMPLPDSAEERALSPSDRTLLLEALKPR